MADHFAITSSALPTHARVAAFRGSEGISRPYVFDIDVSVDSVGDVEGSEVDVDDALGARATLTINDTGGDPVVIHGVIGSMELLRSVSLSRGFDRVNTLYRVQLVPALWHLSLTRHSRIWSGKTVPEVIKDVLETEGAGDFELRLERAYDVEEHICQYKESSLAFIHRWMERLGLFYFFEQGDRRETLVITDSNAASVPSIARPVPYVPGDDARSGSAHFNVFTWRHSSTPTAVRLTDYDYARPGHEMVGSATVSSYGAGEQVTYGGRFFTQQQGQALASVRAEDLRARAKTFHATGRVYGVTAGYRFTLDLHPRAALNTEYLAVSVEHFGAVSEAVKTWGKTTLGHDHVEETYRVELSAIDARQPYRHPEVTPWPRLDGFENAVVDGPSTSDYAQIDDQGRYKVKFKFDEGTLRGGQASTWVRKMQPHAGAVEGWHFPERAGTEVVCAFLGGDPDRPIIIGAVPTVTTASPVTSANSTQNVIQTGGRNRVEMEDQSGMQRVTISTPTASTFLSLGHPVAGLSQIFTGDRQVAGHEASLATDANIILSSGATTDFSIGGQWNVWVDQTHTEIIVGDTSQTVTTGNHTQTISAGNLTQTVAAGTLTQTVQSDVTETYNAKLTQHVVGAVQLTHDTGYKHTVSGGLTHEIFQTGQKVEVSGGDMEMTVSGNHKADIKGYEEKSVLGPFTFTKKAAADELTMGETHNIFLGMKTELNAGAFTGITLGAKVDVTVAGIFELCVAAKAKVTVGPEVNLYTSKSELQARRDKLAAMETHLNAINNSLAAVKTFSVAVARQNAGLASAARGMHQQINGLKSDINGLTSIL